MKIINVYKQILIAKFIQIIMIVFNVKKIII